MGVDAPACWVIDADGFLIRAGAVCVDVKCANSGRGGWKKLITCGIGKELFGSG